MAGQPLLEPLRDSLRVLLGVPCFIRRSRDPGFLFVTDALSRAGEADQVLCRLSRDGSWSFRREGGLMQLDPGQALWQKIMASAPEAAPVPMDEQTAYPFLQACANRLVSETVPPERQPVAMLRLTLKCLEAGEIDRLQDELPVEIAVVLVLISMLLTLFAGIIPSRSAAKKDPVVALRTE